MCKPCPNLMSVFRHAHPGSPYVFGLVGDDHDLEFPDPMPVVGMSRGNLLMKNLLSVKTLSINSLLTCSILSLSIGDSIIIF